MGIVVKLESVMDLEEEAGGALDRLPDACPIYVYECAWSAYIYHKEYANYYLLKSWKREPCEIFECNV